MSVFSRVKSILRLGGSRRAPLAAAKPSAKGTASAKTKASKDAGPAPKAKAATVKGAQAAVSPATSSVTHAPPKIIETIAIDVRHDILGTDGVMRAKTPAIYPSAAASTAASIIIPCYNYGRYLPEAVDSALAQTLSDIDIVIVDNGSEDPLTIKVVDGYRDTPRITVVRLTPNRGLPAARNAGIAAAKGEYICSLDADDYFEPTYLEKAVAALESDRSLGFVHSWVQVFGNERFVWQTRDFVPDQAVLDNHTAVSGVFRRDDWEHAGKYEPSMHGGYDDWDFWTRLAILGRRGKVIREPLINHRKHGKNMTGDAHAARAGWIAKMHTLNPSFFNDPKARSRLNHLRAREQGSPDTLYVPLTAKHAAAVNTNPAALPRAVLFVGGISGEAVAHVAAVEMAKLLAPTHQVTIVTTGETGETQGAPTWSGTPPEVFHLADLAAKPTLALAMAIVADRAPCLLIIGGSALAYDFAQAWHAQKPETRVIDLLVSDFPAGEHLYRALHMPNVFAHHIAVERRISVALKAARVAPDCITSLDTQFDCDGPALPALLGLSDLAAARALRLSSQTSRPPAPLEVTPESLAVSTSQK
ncbi:MAG: glycosyltransferase family 2 protein [Hyphomicrobium sp.]